MENNSHSPEDYYEHYADLPDVPVDCFEGSCVPASTYLVAALTVYAAIFLVGVPGNTLVACVSRKRAGHRAGATWFLHLAMADLFCCLSLPFLAVAIAHEGHWPFGAVGCRLLPSVILLSMYASVLLLAALSADLCLLALGVTWWAAAWRAHGVRVARGGAWTVALMLVVPSVFHRRLHQEHFPSRLECVVDYKGSVALEGTVSALRFLFGFLGPLAFVVGCHWVVLCRVAHRHWPLSTAIMVGFFLCWTPYHITGLVLTAAAPNSALLARALQAEPLVAGLALAHSCLNPILFLYFGRTQLRQSLPAACHWALRESQDREDSVAGKLTTSYELVSDMKV
ncbi:C5a anaphylatoxin chemotactic receptor 2 [Ctenodactylus gundi]